VIIRINYKIVYVVILMMALAFAALFMTADTKSHTERPVMLVNDAARVLIIDAGHGGEDGGAQSSDGLLESGVNLDIVLRMESLCSLMGIPYILTRDSDNIQYPDTAVTTSSRKSYDQKQRAELVNSFENKALISIHQNNFPDPRPKGAQVLYSAYDGSRELGELMHKNLILQLYPENRRVASPISEKIYLLRVAKCPSVLVECAFLSNPEEAMLLKTDEYKTSLAMVILGSYMQFDKGMT